MMDDHKLLITIKHTQPVDLINASTLTNKEDRIKIEVQNNKGLIVGGDLNITGEDALKIKKYLKKFLSEEAKPTTAFRHKLFKWVQTNFNNNQYGNRGVIETISEKPLKVIFEDPYVKNLMTADLNWQEKLYIVDVEVEYLNGKPKLYKIIDVD